MKKSATKTYPFCCAESMLHRIHPPLILYCLFFPSETPDLVVFVILRLHFTIEEQSFNRFRKIYFSVSGSMRRLAAKRKKAAPKRIDNAAKLCYDKQNAVTGRVRPAPQAERGRSVQVLVRQGSGRSSLSVARQSGPRAGQGTGRGRE